LTFAIPTAFADVYIDNDHKYLGDDGTLHVVGEIINESNKPINQVEVTAVFYSDGSAVYHTSTENLTSMIMPEMKGVFDLVVTETIANIDHYTLDVDFKITQPKDQVIEITSSEFTHGPVDNIAIQGTVANNGEITANMVKVVAILYDRDGNVVAVSQANTKPDYLRVNDESFFLIPILDQTQANKIVDYSLVAESEEYTAVPEFPLGSGVLLVASLSAYIALTKNPSVVTRSLVRLSNMKLPRLK
tara:strand:+ start:249 stop:986 length:738 start_codon:yes stop_codon:yes gene_type:complete